MASRFSYFAAAAVIAWGGIFAQSAAADDALTAVQRAIGTLQTQIEQMKQSYEAQIAGLKSRIETLEKEKTAMAPAAKAAVVRPQAPASIMPTTLPAPAAAPAQSAAAMPTTLPPLSPGAAPAPAGPAAPYPASAAATPASAGAFNPAISVVLNGMFGTFDHSPDNAKVPGFQLGPDSEPGPRGLSIGESEIALGANIDPYMFGNLVISFNQQNEVSVEEAYIQSTSLPWGFTAKAGRFFSGIGYLNENHAHNWAFIDAPLPYRAFLNTQYGDDGVQLRWLAPVGMFVEFGAEAFRGDAFPAANAANEGKGAFSGFVHFGGDINQSSSWLGGMSFLQTRSNGRSDGMDTFSGKDNTGIASLVYKWAPNGNQVQQNLIVNGEFFFGNEEGRFDGNSFDQGRMGWYLQAVYQFMPRWRVGLRHDEVSAGDMTGALLGTALDPQGHTPNNNSVLLEFDTSEFGRFRFQYNRDNADFTSNNEFIAAYTAIFGPHGAHRF
jgi:hypothetical protein